MKQLLPKDLTMQVAQILLARNVNRAADENQKSTVNFDVADKAIRIARLEAKIEAYNDAINGGIDFTKGWLRMAETELKELAGENNIEIIEE